MSYYIIITKGFFEIFDHNQWTEYCMDDMYLSEYEIVYRKKLEEYTKTKTYHFPWLHLTNFEDIQNIIKLVFETNKINSLCIMKSPPKKFQSSIIEMVSKYPLNELKLGMDFDNSLISKLSYITKLSLKISDCKEITIIANKMPINIKSLSIRMQCICNECNVDELFALPLEELDFRQHICISEYSYQVLAQNTHLRNLVLDEFIAEVGTIVGRKLPSNLKYLSLNSATTIRDTKSLIRTISHVQNVNLFIKVRESSIVICLLEQKNIKTLSICNDISPTIFKEVIEKNVDLINFQILGKDVFEPYLIRNRKIAQYQIMLDIAIVFSFLPPYIALEIFDWLFSGKYDVLSHLRKITTIQKIHNFRFKENTST